MSITTSAFVCILQLLNLLYPDFAVFCHDDFVGIARQLAQEVVGGGGGIDAYPMFGGFVEGVADAGVLFSQLEDALWLAFEGDDAEFVAVKEREHMAADVEPQHPFTVFKLGERKLLLDALPEREAIFAIRFNVHICFLSV